MWGIKTRGTETETKSGERDKKSKRVGKRRMHISSFIKIRSLQDNHGVPHGGACCVSSLKAFSYTMRFVPLGSAHSVAKVQLV